jgi:H+/Cl- antiporter ClcA
MKLYEKIGVIVAALSVFLPTIVYVIMGRNQDANSSRLMVIALVMVVFSILATLTYLYFYFVKLKVFAAIGLMGFIGGLIRLYQIILPQSAERHYNMGAHVTQMTYIVMGLILGAYGQLVYWIAKKIYDQIINWEESTRKETVKGFISIALLTCLLAAFVVGGLNGWRLMVKYGIFHL